MSNVTYGYGIQTLESVSVHTQQPYKIRFYTATSPANMGVFQSHGYTYLETRKALQDIDKTKPMGLDKILGEKK